ncbi:MAG: hypothetical protein AB8B64_18410 [Granulosicoccus sp.]
MCNQIDDAVASRRQQDVTCVISSDFLGISISSAALAELDFQAFEPDIVK